MKNFQTFEMEIRSLIETVISSNTRHAMWLNTLSYLENCGARKIAACEHPTLVKEEMLKHAAEEFRHAHYLKRQIGHIVQKPIHTYSPKYLLGGQTTLHYLSALDIYASRYLKQQGLTRDRIKEAAYLLVTYAIELRAEVLYPIYETLLRQSNSCVRVKSILLEEQEHLHEMRVGIMDLPLGEVYAQHICEYENALCEKWVRQIQNEIRHSF